MLWCRFQAGSEPSFGIIEDGTVSVVRGTPFGDYARTSTRYPIGGVKLLVPCAPPTFYAAGINYPDHVGWASEYFQKPLSQPKRPDIGYRAVNALIAHDEPIVIPKDSIGEVHYEGELVAVVGRAAKHLTPDNALDCILGYTIGNDVSERGWQQGDRTLWRAKNADSFKPVGPWIVTDFDPAQAETTVRINDKVVSQFATGAMTFDLPTYLVEMSKYITLQPGDIIMLGTEGATLPPIRPGDVVEVEISGIGTLRNPVVAET